MEEKINKQVKNFFKSYITLLSKVSEKYNNRKLHTFELTEYSYYESVNYIYEKANVISTEEHYDLEDAFYEELKKDYTNVSKMQFVSILNSDRILLDSFCKENDLDNPFEYLFDIYKTNKIIFDFNDLIKIKNGKNESK